MSDGDRPDSHLPLGIEEAVIHDRLSRALGQRIDPVTLGAVMGLIDGLASDGRRLTIVKGAVVVCELRSRGQKKRVVSGQSVAACLMELIS